MKKLFNQESFKSIQGQLGTFSASVKSQLAANMPSLAQQTSVGATNNPSSQPQTRQPSISGGSNEVNILRDRIEQLQALEDEVPMLRAQNETLKARLHEVEKKPTAGRIEVQTGGTDETLAGPTLGDSAHWQEEKAGMELEMSSLRSALRASEEDNAALQSRAQDLPASSETPPSSSSSSQSNPSSSLLAQIDALKAELESLASSKSSVEIELKVSRSTLASQAQRLAEMADGQHKAEEVLQRYEQLCEEAEDSRERAEAAEMSLGEATKALELLQEDLSAQTRSMIESQEAYEELRDKLEQHSSFRAEMEARVSAAEKRAMEAEAKLKDASGHPPSPGPSVFGPSEPLKGAHQGLGSGGDGDEGQSPASSSRAHKAKPSSAPSLSSSLLALGDSPGGYLRQALQEVTAEVATLRANMVTRSTSGGGGGSARGGPTLGGGGGGGSTGGRGGGLMDREREEERPMLERLVEDLAATEVALLKMRRQLDAARAEAVMLRGTGEEGGLIPKGQGEEKSSPDLTTALSSTPPPSSPRPLVDISATIPWFYAQIRASHGGLKRLAESVEEMEGLAEMAASIGFSQSGEGVGGARGQRDEGGEWRLKYEELKLALAHHQSTQDQSLSSIGHQLDQTRSEAKGHQENATRLGADCARLASLVEDRGLTIKSLEDQVEDLGKSLSKINAQYQKQFARFEADQSTTIESVKIEARAQLEASKAEAQALLAAARSQSTSELEALRSAARRNEEERDERLDRLQKLNRKQAAEKDAMSAELASHQSKVMALEAQDKQSKVGMSALKTKVAAMEPLMSELEALKKKLQEATAMAQKYDRAEKERLELLKRVNLLEAQANESKVLREELLKLSNVNVELQALKARLDAAEEARDQALSEASRSSSMLTNLEGRLEQVEEDNESLSTALEQLRRRAAAQSTHPTPHYNSNPPSKDTSRGESNLGGSPPSTLEDQIRSIMSTLEGGQGTLLPRDRWPAPLVAFVMELEAADRAEAAMQRSSNSPDRKSSQQGGDGKIGAEGSSLTSLDGLDPHPSHDLSREGREDRSSSASLEEMLRARSNTLTENRLLVSERKVVDLSSQLEAMQGRLEGEVERGREADEEARVRFESARASWIKEAEEEALHHSSELSRLQHLLKESSTMRGRASTLEDQLVAMRDKSRLMLEEKEREFEALQGTIRQLQLMHGSSSSSSSGQLVRPNGQGSGGGRAKGTVVNTPPPPTMPSSGNSFSSVSVDQLRAKIGLLERDLRDSEKTHDLRSISEQALKDELSSIRSVLKMASSGDKGYMALRAAIVSGLEQGMFVSKPGHMFTMLTRMLQLSPQEIKRVEAGANKGK